MACNGEIVIVFRMAVLTITVAVPEAPPKAAVTVAPIGPVGATPRTLPWAVKITCVVSDEVQTESSVTSCEVPSEKTPVACSN